MLTRWMTDLESLEPFVAGLHGDAGLGEETGRALAELGRDEPFLLAAEDDVR